MSQSISIRQRILITGKPHFHLGKEMQGISLIYMSIATTGQMSMIAQDTI